MEDVQTLSYWQVVILVSWQHGMVELVCDFLFYQYVLMHFQLFCMFQSAIYFWRIIPNKKEKEQKVQR